MSKNEIIEQWFRDNVVQDIVKKVSNGSKDAKYDDLTSIVYLFLLEKDDDFIKNLWKNGQYKYYIARMVMLQLASTKSRWYYQIRRFSALSSEYDFNKPDNSCDNELREQMYELIDFLPTPEAELLKDYDYFGTMKDVERKLGHCHKWGRKHINKAIGKLNRLKEIENERLLQIHK